jgi:hypothetical protein
MFSSVASADGSLGAAAARVSGTCLTYVPSGSNLVAWDRELKIREARCSIGARAGDPQRSAFSYNPRPDSDEE